MSVIGFLGVGHLAVAMIDGLIAAGHPAGNILLAPRGQAERVHRRQGAVLADDNRDLVDRCDFVVLATRPADAVPAIAELDWRPGQTLISACAGVPLASLASAVAPAAACRIMPLTVAAFGASPTTLFPVLPAVEALLAPLGPVIPLAHEADFEITTVSAAAYGWAQAVIARNAHWQAAQGLDPAVARRICALTFVAAGRMVATSDRPMETLLQELVTPGGITERGLEILEQAEAISAWDEASAAVLRKLRGLA